MWAETQGHKRDTPQYQQFQSTPPVWAETYKEFRSIQLDLISIHSARVGGDMALTEAQKRANAFQSTPPVWAETDKRYFIRIRRQFQSTPPVWAETC